MYILLKPGMRIFDFHQQFQEMFPYLKIELCNAGNNNLILHNDSDPEARFSAVEKHRDLSILITPETKFHDLAEEFRNIFGLQASLYRKIGSSWIKTFHTNGWALQDQNDQGRKISGYIDRKPEE